MQFPFVMNTSNPRCCCAVSAFGLGGLTASPRNLSKGASSETSVASYNMTERPQNSEKFASICLNDPTGSVELQYLSWNAFMTSWAYVRLRPVGVST